MRFNQTYKMRVGSRNIIQPGQHPPKPEAKPADSGYRPAGELAEKPLDWMLF
jgi:hypothetical protein